MGKIVFSDIDGTLLKNDHTMSKTTHDGITSLMANGVPFVIVTSRHPGGVYPILKKCDIKIPFITYGGGLAMDENHQVIFSKGLTKSEASDVITFLKNKKYDCDANIYSYDEWVCENIDSYRVKHEESIVECICQKGGLDDIHSDTVHKILVMCEEKDTKEIAKSLENNFPNLEVIISWATLIEVNPKGINKAFGIQNMIDRLGYHQEDTIAFGDNYNDLSMLEYVKYPFLMDNAPSGMKERIKTLTSSNEDDGVIKGLQKMGLL